MNFATWVFRLSGIYGLLVLVPQYLMEERISRDFPPAITHPDHFYGFVGVAVAWQVAFLVIASDPQRFRPLMPVAALEKVLYGAAVVVLFAQQRVAATILGFAIADLLWGALFAAAWWRIRDRSSAA